LNIWGAELNDRGEDVKKTMKGKYISATHMQTVSYIKPLFRKLKRKVRNARTKVRNARTNVRNARTKVRNALTSICDEQVVYYKSTIRNDVKCSKTIKSIFS